MCSSDLTGIVYDVVLPAATARVEAPRFELVGSIPAGVVATVTDSLHLTLAAPAKRGCQVTVVPSVDRATRRTVSLRAGETKQLTFTGALTPTPDLALGRTTYPTSPLPASMSDPAYAVDGDPRTAWLPGSNAGRMVVDLGAATALGALTMRWTTSRVAPFTVSVSDDGLSYTQVVSGDSRHDGKALTLNTTTRYVALAVSAWSHADAGLVSLTLTA